MKKKKCQKSRGTAILSCSFSCKIFTTCYIGCLQLPFFDILFAIINRGCPFKFLLFLPNCCNCMNYIAIEDVPIRCLFSCQTFAISYKGWPFKFLLFLQIFAINNVNCPFTLLLLWQPFMQLATEAVPLSFSFSDKMFSIINRGCPFTLPLFW